MSSHIGTWVVLYVVYSMMLYTRPDVYYSAVQYSMYDLTICNVQHERRMYNTR